MACNTCNDPNADESCGCEGGRECPCCGLTIIAEADEVEYEEESE